MATARALTKRDAYFHAFGDTAGSVMMKFIEDKFFKLYGGYL
jgi:hypothetical protein